MGLTYAIGITLRGVQAFWHRGAVRHCLPGKCHILAPEEPTMACLAVESVLSEDAVLIIRGARETRSSKVHVPLPINLGRAVLQLSWRGSRCNYTCYIKDTI